MNYVTYCRFCVINSFGIPPTLQEGMKIINLDIPGDLCEIKSFIQTLNQPC